jgi:hypothetical protein
MRHAVGGLLKAWQHREQKVADGSMIGKKPTLKRCWVCKSGGQLTGEHGINRADLQDIFGAVTQSDPVYLQTNQAKNAVARSLKSKLLKSKDTMCAFCNGGRTQPHDHAFTAFRRALTPMVLASGGRGTVRCNRLLPHDTGAMMLAVHLHFVKKFGEYIVDSGASIDIEPFAQAIRTGRAHPNVLLRFGLGPTFADGVRHTGRSHMAVVNVDGDPADVRFAMWFAGYDGLTVSVMLAMPGERREGMRDTWHPRQGAKTLTLADFRGLSPKPLGARII